MSETVPPEEEARLEFMSEEVAYRLVADILQHPVNGKVLRLSTKLSDYAFERLMFHLENAIRDLAG